jgi:hypothetical protein
MGYSFVLLGNALVLTKFSTSGLSATGKFARNRRGGDYSLEVGQHPATVLAPLLGRKNAQVGQLTDTGH